MPRCWRDMGNNSHWPLRFNGYQRCWSKRTLLWESDPTRHPGTGRIGSCRLCFCGLLRIVESHQRLHTCKSQCRGGGGWTPPNSARRGSLWVTQLVQIVTCKRQVPALFCLTHAVWRARQFAFFQYLPNFRIRQRAIGEKHSKCVNQIVGRQVCVAIFL